jgi:hypothetical protein
VIARRFIDLVHERMGHAVGLAVALTAMDSLRVASVVAATPGTSFAAVVLEELCHWLLRCGLLVTMLSLCEALPVRRLVKSTVTLAAVGAGIWATSGHLEIALFGDAQAKALGLMGPGFGPYVAWLQGAAALLLAWYYAARSAAAEAVAALRQAETAREQEARLVLESRLEIARARVDPQWLLDSLRQVQALYEKDSARAEGALDEVIERLRAAFQARTSP